VSKPGVALQLAKHAITATIQIHDSITGWQMIFSTYNQAGLSVIPLRAKRKNPMLSGWSNFNKELPTKDNARYWDEMYPFPEKSNIGLCLGQASGVMAVDIDTDDQRTHRAVPDSPFRRVGKPGREVRFYKYNSEIKSSKDHPRCVEIFSHTGQVVLPPSIHPDTNEPYRWIGEMKLLDDEWREHLPEMKDLKWLEKCPIIKSETDTTQVTGRNNRLTDVLCSIFGRGESIDYATEEVLKIDASEHAGNEYFLDESESFVRNAGGNKGEAARAFCEDQYRRLKRKGMILDPVNIEIDLTNIDKAAKKLFVPLPKAPGIIGEIQEDILRCVPVKQPQLAMGAALALLSTCALGRFVWRGNWPNLFVMNVAVSGGGKDDPQKYVKRALSHELLELENLTGLGIWQSSVSMISDFPIQRFRIDVMDEFGGFIKEASKGNAFKQAAMMQANELYSQKGEKFLGIKSATRGKDTGACIGPGLSVLASIQPDILSLAANREMFDNGFLRRFLYFIADQPRDLQVKRNLLNADATARKLKTIVMRRPALYSGAGIGGMNADMASWIPNCLQMETDPAIEDLIDEASLELFAMDEEYHVRLTENAMRLTMLSAIANDRTTVNADDLSFGVELVKALAYNGQSLLKEASSGSKFGKDQGRVIRWLNEKDSRTSTTQAFNRVFDDMMPSYKRDVMKSLIDSGRVKQTGNVIALIE
jgi:hypothetical protein